MKIPTILLLVNFGLFGKAQQTTTFEKLPDSCKAAYRKGTNAYMQERFSDALQLLMKVEACGYVDTFLYFGLGRSSLATGDYQAAVRYFDLFDKKITDSFFWSYGNRAIAYHNLKNFDESLKDFNLSINLYKKRNRKSDDGWVLFRGRALLFTDLGRLDDARNDYHSAIENYPAEILNYLELAELDVMQGMYDSVDHRASAIQRINPENGYQIVYAFLQYCSRLLNEKDVSTIKKVIEEKLNQPFSVTWYFENYNNALKSHNISDDHFKDILIIEERIKQGNMIASPSVPAKRQKDTSSITKTKNSPYLVFQGLQADVDEVDMATFFSSGYQTVDHNGLVVSYPRASSYGMTAKNKMITHSGGLITLWDIRTGKEVRRIQNTARVLNMSLSDSGRLLVTTDINNKCRVWDLFNGEMLKEFADVQIASISPSGEHILLIAEDREEGQPQTFTGIYDAANYSLIFPIQIQPRYIPQVGFSPDGSKFFLMESSPTSLRVFDLRTKTTIGNFGIEGAEHARFSNDSRHIFAYGHDLVIKNGEQWAEKGSIHFYDLPNESEHFPTFQFSEHVDELIMLSDNHRAIVIAGNSCLLVDIKERKTIRTFQFDKSLPARTGETIVTAVTLSPDEKTIIGGTNSGQLYFWKLEKETPVKTLKASTNYIRNLNYSWDGKEILIFSGDPGTILILDEDSELVFNSRQMAKYGEINEICFSSDGQKLLIQQGTRSVLWTLTEESKPVKYNYPSIITPGGKFLATGEGDIWNLSGRIKIASCSFPLDPDKIMYFPDSTKILTVFSDSMLSIWDVKSCKVTMLYRPSKQFGDYLNLPIATTISPNGKMIATLHNARDIRLCDSNGKLIRNLLYSNAGIKNDSTLDLKNDKITTVKFSKSSTKLIAGYESGIVIVWEVSGKCLGYFRVSLGGGLLSLGDHGISKVDILEDRFAAIALGSNGVFKTWQWKDSSFQITPDHQVQDMELALGFGSYAIYRGRVNDFAISHDGRILLTGGQDGVVKVWDCHDGKLIKQFDNNYRVSAVAISPDYKIIAIAGEYGTVRLWNYTSNKEIASLVSFDDEGWAIFTPEGYFDTDDPEDIRGVQWVFPDDPFLPLAPEVFMRDFYTPNLLFKRQQNSSDSAEVFRDLSKLNRTQPAIVKMEVSPQKGAYIAITLHITGIKSKITGKTGCEVFDVRLFRDRQLIRQLPQAGNNYFYRTNTRAILADKELAEWRDHTRIRSVTDTITIVFDSVKIPSSTDSVTFSAYGFNEDRVKSQTYKIKYVNQQVGKQKARAFIVTIGVSQNATGWHLATAANDSRVIRSFLVDQLSKNYDVTPITLVSSFGPKVFPDEIIATKRNIKLVLEKLSGLPVQMDSSTQFLQRIDMASPEDLVMIFFSGHGYSGADGTFYLVPSNSYDAFGLRYSAIEKYFANPTQSKDLIVRQFIQSCISTNELAEWIYYLDAGDKSLVIDACQAGNALGNESVFRAGPMGDPGFGQVIYDKAIRLLVATPAGQPSIGNAGEALSLLTFALTRPDAKKFFQEGILRWLELGPATVPLLISEHFKGVTNTIQQRPRLYNFYNR